MSERLDAKCPVEGKDGKTFWLKCGVAWPDKGGGYMVYLDTLPINGKLRLAPPYDGDKGRGGGGGGGSRGGYDDGPPPISDDDVPF